MKKIYLYLIITFGIVVASGAMFVKAGAETVSLDSVFAKENLTDMGSYVEGNGCYAVCYLEEDEKKALLINIASAMGMEPEYDISVYENANMEYMTLSRHAMNATVIIKLITEKKTSDAGVLLATQYITVSIDMPDSINDANYYYEIIEECFERLGVEGSVCINLYGSRMGMLDIVERNKLADELLSELSAKVVAENRDADMFTIYGYSQGIKDYLEIGGNRINVNIAMNYDEINNTTNIFLSSPINSGSY